MNPAAERAAAAMAQAAQNYLESLDKEQSQEARWPFPADDERLR